VTKFSAAKDITMPDLTRVELHGPARELEKLKEPLAHLDLAWFVLETARK
jgi:hypothetical protein